MRKFEIVIYLKPEGSEQIRALLERKGFAIYRQDPSLQSLDRLKKNKNMHFLPTIGYNRIFCIYNGDKSLKELGINQTKLEMEETVIDVKISYRFQKANT